MCVIGDTSSGKTSLLQAIIGDMISVSDDTTKELGGLDKTKTSEEFMKL